MRIQQIIDKISIRPTDRKIKKVKQFVQQNIMPAVRKKV